MKFLKNGALQYLDRLGDPFLFLEERLVKVGPGRVEHAANTLPKVVFALEGTLQVAFEGAGTRLLQPGSVLVNFRHLRQTYSPVEPGRGGYLRVLRLTLPWEKFEKKSARDDFSSYLRDGLPSHGVLPAPGRVPWDRWLHEARSQLSARHPDRRFRTQAALRMVLLELVRNWQQAAGSGTPEADAARHLQERVDRYVEDHLEESLSLADIAAAVDRSEEHVSRVYRQQRGIALFDEIKRLRIERAKYFLLCTDLSVTRIAEKSGFATLAHFSRTFRQSSGKSPRDFREEH